ncbi:hypothetical protein FDP41_004402 [Naegleria fowleri]|uniref:DUF4116 domain-containing protein n=1 Tax=Naegleria fowleri TaxID=5763 RepID=A0A6A5BFA1_NAEFO|nr:uncharacterized protein FDP41_004402 [Naegleria fowleri]KAF0976503.1 hypothetical protein FDP41_004402 [Naegleria fowleri]
MVVGKREIFETTPYRNNCPINLEFMDDRYCVEKIVLYYSYNIFWEYQWMIQKIDIEELCNNNQELLANVEFWLPFKIGILKLIVDKKLKVLEYIPKDVLLEWKEVILNALKSEIPCSFCNIPKNFQENRDCLLEALRNRRTNMKDPVLVDILEKYAAEKKDREMIMMAISKDERYLKHFSNDRDIILALISHYHKHLKHETFDFWLKGISNSVKDFGFVLKFISEDGRNDRDFMLKLLQNPLDYVFEIASEKLKFYFGMCEKKILQNWKEIYGKQMIGMIIQDI